MTVVEGIMYSCICLLYEKEDEIHIFSVDVFYRITFCVVLCMVVQPYSKNQIYN